MKEKQILNAAKELFNKYGYKRVSMDEIAKVAGVTKKTVYSYFKNKEEFLKYFLNEEVQNMKKIYEENEIQDRPFFENLHGAIYEMIKYIQKRSFLKIIFEESEAFKKPVIVDNLKIMHTSIQKYIQEKLQIAADNNQIIVPNVEVTAFIIYKMYVALVLEWGDEKMDEKLITDTLMNLLRNGLEVKGGENG